MGQFKGIANHPMRRISLAYSRVGINDVASSIGIQLMTVSVGSTLCHHVFLAQTKRILQTEV